MGKLKQGILGGFSGKVANIVGSSWKGIAIVKAMPLSVANPKTAAQVGQRDKFTYIVELTRSILTSIVKPFWDRFAQYMSGYNAFIKANIDTCDGTSIITPGSFVISQGKMASTVISGYSITASTKILSVSWSDDSGAGYKTSSDIAIIFLYNSTKKTYEIGFDPSVPKTRADLGITYTLQNEYTEADNCNVYLAFKRADGTVVSNTGTKFFAVSA